MNLYRLHLLWNDEEINLHYDSLFFSFSALQKALRSSGYVRFSRLEKEKNSFAQKSKFIFSSFLYLFFALVFTGCYSFKGTSIPPGVQTFTVEKFDIRASNSPAALNQRFTDELKDKIQRESRLNLVNADGDIEFSGTITEYSISPIAPRPGEEAESRLQISMSVEYVDLTDKENNWTQTFSRYEDYPTTSDFTSIEDNLIGIINEQIIEDIFNKAFTNW